MGALPVGLVFVEVKSRGENSKGFGYEAITFNKLSKLKRAIYYFLKVYNAYYSNFRIDIVSVELSTDKTLKNIKHYPNISSDDIK